MDFSFLFAMKFELLLTLLIFILLIQKINGTANSASVLTITFGLLIINFVLGFLGNTESSLFGGMFYSNHLLALEKNILNLAVLIISFTSYHWLKNHKHLAEFFILLLSSLLGLFFMLSSGNLLMFYLGLELSTIPLAALCNFDLEKKISSEAAMKMIMSSAFSSAILLFGISMMYGTTGTLEFSEIPKTLYGSQLQILAFILLFTGFAFKLSVVPFHLWTADVYEGSPIAVTAFLSVVSKGAMSFVFITTLYKAFAPLAQTWYFLLAGSAVITMTIGNLFALRQQNLKRFFAFSSIAQVGYVLIGISSASQVGVASVVYFILIYVFSNLAAFGVLSIVSSITGKETISDYKGFYKSNPTLALILALSLFSLAGIPPTAGFFGKLFLLTTGAAVGTWWVIIIAALNMVVSLYYYLRIIRAMFVDEAGELLPKISLEKSELVALVVCVIGILVIGFASRTFDVIFNLSANL
ncbi:MAG: NADH-quinone oxidoreductase subunit N [Bacteroidetes bacterium]|nr:NADH-quinone oxidoreductase subunit N [Bacteroidota bacterium]